MKTNLSLFLSLFLLSTTLSAAPARFVYYIMSQTNESVCDDSVLTVEYDITNPLVCFDQAGCYHPQPQISIVLTNKTDNIIHLVVSDSKIMRNSHVQELGEIASGTEILIAPHSSISFDGIILLTQEATSFFNNIYHHRHMKVMKNDYGMLCFGNLDNKFESGRVVSYGQSNTPVCITTLFVYTLGEDDTRYNITTQYFAEKKVGSGLNAFGQENENIINEVFPDWVNPKYEIIKLACFKAK
ncbi:MAG: hypothetical protein E7117_06720 [Bacteroidales bacterium]|nr:hypothetical protein [Bacteroidales bacterium]